MLWRGQTTSVAVFAPAKLNLFLKVLGKRVDGYHELETLMVSVSLYDTLLLTDDPDGRLWLTCRDGRPSNCSTTQDPLPSGPDNLVFRAAQLLKTTTGVSRGARIELVKRIPLAAGL